MQSLHDWPLRLFLFDRSGKTAQVPYGAPPGLHKQVGKVLDRLSKE